MQLRGSGGETEEKGALHPLGAAEYLQKVDPLQAQFSRGFLQSRPERWFPGFSAQWFPLIHSLNVDLKIVEVLPVLGLEVGNAIGYAGYLDEERIAVFVEGDDANLLSGALFPGTQETPAAIFMEYLARRFLGSLALSWTGPESASLRFEGAFGEERQELPGTFMGGVKLSLLVNNEHCSVWVAFTRPILERLDSLWKRQIHSSKRAGEAPGELRIQIAELAVPLQMIADYTRPGTVIDLELMVNDVARLLVSDKAHLQGRLCSVEGKLAFQVMEESPSHTAVPEGSARLSFEMGAVSLDSHQLSEVSQAGSIHVTALPVSDEADVIINGKKVARAILYEYEGRFAATIK